MQKFEKYFGVLFLLLLSLTPIYWFLKKPGILIDGVDTNFPLDPEIWFQRRFFTWQHVANAGSDFSASSAGTFFHLIQYLPFKLGFSLQIVELFSLLFWFSLIIFSTWILSRIFFPKKTFPQLIFVSLYTLNIYLFNTWENVKVANLALVSSIPLGLSLLLLLRSKSIGKGNALILSTIVGIILAGAGINPAYIICFFVILSLAVVSEFFFDFGNWKKIFENYKNFLLISIFIILINSFWIIPSIHFIVTNITSSNSIGSIGFTNWIDSLSQNTSLVNVFRMLGAWDWYSFDSTGAPLYIPYSLKYFNNPLFVGFSFLVPGIALCAFMIKEKRKNLLYIFFGIILVFGLFLTAGTHPPTGVLFNFLANHVPFFSLFRSPWYIFASLVGLSIAGLVGLFFYKLEESEIPKIITDFIALMFIATTLIYAYPLILGRIFRPMSNYGFMVNFPDYVFKMRDYLRNNNLEGRLLSYPDDNIERFKWGYSGTDSILNLLSDKEIIFSPLNGTSSALSKIISNIYSAIKRDEMTKSLEFAKVLNITKIFNKSDQDSLSSSLPIEITKQKNVKFGNWSIYDLPFSNSSKIWAGKSFILSFPYRDSDKNISLLESGEILINAADSTITKNNLNISGNIVHAKNLQLADFQIMDIGPSDLKSRVYSRDLSTVQFDFDVQDDGIYSPILEKYGVSDFGILNQNKISVLVDGKSEMWNLDNSDDSYLYFASINFTKGQHSLQIRLNNKNLIELSNFTENGKGQFNISNGIYNMFNTSNKDISMNFNVTNFDPYAYYLIDLSYQQIYGNNAQIIVDQRNKNVLFKDQSQSLPNYPGWQDFSFYYHPVESASDITMDLIAPYTKDPLGTKVQYKNLAVYKVFSNDLFLKKKSKNNMNLPIVTFKKDSPVSYSGDIKDAKGPFVLVFNENYSPDWQITLNNGNLDKISHFTANYYANAWYIDSNSPNYKFTIYYKPQILLKIGYIISGITIIASIYFVYARKSK